MSPCREATPKSPLGGWHVECQKLGVRSAVSAVGQTNPPCPGSIGAWLSGLHNQFNQVGQDPGIAQFGGEKKAAFLRTESAFRFALMPEKRAQGFRGGFGTAWGVMEATIRCSLATVV